MGSARQDGRDAAGSDGPERLRNRPYTTHERFPHRHLLSTLPVEQDQAFQRSEYHHEASEHQRVNLLYPGPCRAQPTLFSILPLDDEGSGATTRESGPKRANLTPLRGRASCGNRPVRPANSLASLGRRLPGCLRHRATRCATQAPGTSTSLPWPGCESGDRPSP